MSRTYVSGCRYVRNNYHFKHGEYHLQLPVLSKELLDWRWPSFESRPSGIFKAPDMIAPNQREATPLLDDAPTSNKPNKPPVSAHLGKIFIVANEDAKAPLSNSTLSNAAASSVDTLTCTSTQEIKPTCLGAGKENHAQGLGSDNQVLSGGSPKTMKDPAPSKKPRRVILILPKVADTGVAPETRNDLPPKKRKRSCAADGKKKIIRRKYTEHKDESGLEYKQCNLCEEAIYGNHKNHSSKCGKGIKGKTLLRATTSRE
ncbi:hypothetical protein EYR38_009961 [Pleurotus pulmonarius]|nr:hypothetical protein EYR38_009961 [Pleurotus pulmonarius]